MDSSVFTSFIEMNEFLKEKKNKFNEEFILLTCDMHLEKNFEDRKIMILNTKKKKENLNCFLFLSISQEHSKFRLIKLHKPSLVKPMFSPHLM